MWYIMDMDILEDGAGILGRTVFRVGECQLILLTCCLRVIN